MINIVVHSHEGEGESKSIGNMIRGIVSQEPLSKVFVLDNNSYFYNQKNISDLSYVKYFYLKNTNFNIADFNTNVIMVENKDETLIDKFKEFLNNIEFNCNRKIYLIEKIVV
jgi:hypothetical protein